jgi:hypothetical protein
MTVASGFISLDSDKRIYPIMPQDPLLSETAIVGLWMWGVTDLRQPYVWSICTRFVFCRSLKAGGNKMATNMPDTFLIVNFRSNQATQFLQLKVVTES